MPETPNQGLQRIDPAGALAMRFRLLPTTLGEAKEMATLIANSELCPKAYRGKPADCIVAYDYGAALGFSWMQSLRSVAVVNGTPSIFGDAVPALILGSGQCERFHETFEGKRYEDDFKAVCIIKRKGLPDETRREFTVAQAKTAKLWQKRGASGGDTPWITYPDRMLQMRARAFAARDAFPDKLSGLAVYEEAMDYPDAIDTVAVSVEPADPLERIPEGLRENIGKAFVALNFSPAQGLAKINEFLGKDGVTPEDGAQQLLDWCKDEYSKRKTGQPRKKEAENGKQPPARENAPSARPSPVPVAAETVPAATAPVAQEAAPQPVTAAEVNWQTTPKPAPEGELF